MTEGLATIDPPDFASAIQENSIGVTENKAKAHVVKHLLKQLNVAVSDLNGLDPLVR